MTGLRLRHLVWIGIVVSILMLTVTVWSQLRLRATRVKIEALSNETSALSEKNDRIRRELENQVALREQLRTHGTRVDLTARKSDETPSGVIYVDETENRLLLELRSLDEREAGDYQLRIRLADARSLTLPLELDPAGDTGLLLDDLPPRIEGFAIEHRTSETQPVMVLMSGRIESP